jgi:hypothetical protein
MTYDNWKCTEPDDFPKPNKERLRVELAEVEKEIAWNERRLTYLIFDEVDRQLTEDMIAELRQERQRLLEVLRNG